MAGKIVADTLEHSTAGSVTTDYVVNGSAKSWQRTTVSGGNPSLNDTLNTSSVTDSGVGNYYYAVSSSLSTTTYCASGNVNEPGGVACINNATGFTTSNYRVYIQNHANSDTDPNYVSNALHGDLA